jgi:glycine/D-amino acid oxidase-like deaminating enzyme
MKTADVIIIGAGVNGAATAYNLVKRGVKKVVLLEKYLIASGGTGRSAALVRQHYSNEELVRMMKRSIQVFHHFDEEVGGDAGFVKSGWAFLVPNSVSEGFERILDMQSRIGIDSREISKAELLAMEPRLNLDDVGRIAYEPGSGYADPHATTYSYVQRFCERGGELMQMTSVLGLVIENGTVQCVKTSKGDISTEVVIDAAGPWAHYVAKWAGLDLPIQVTREEEIILQCKDVGGAIRLAFSDMCKAIYYRPHGATQVLVGRGFPKEYEYVDPDKYKESADPKFIEETSGRLMARVPRFENALLMNAYTGLYDVTPDWYPVLGRVEQVRGFILCAGFSGHGFKLGPAIGELMAEEVIDGKASSIDISRFALSRFSTGELFKAAYGGNRA